MQWDSFQVAVLTAANSVFLKSEGKSREASAGESLSVQLSMPNCSEKESKRMSFSFYWKKLLTRWITNEQTVQNIE